MLCPKKQTTPKAAEDPTHQCDKGPKLRKPRSNRFKGFWGIGKG